MFFALLTLASIGLPTTSGFTGEFLVLLGAFNATWPQYQQGVTLPLLLSAGAVTGVVLGALYMLSFAQRFLFRTDQGAPPARRSTSTSARRRSWAASWSPSSRSAFSPPNR
mgnify:CR=1 FL=1